ncbi:MAG: dnrK [Pedosphaera sp.]|nr:dnrK [Pedosphaera sp.]
MFQPFDLLMTPRTDPTSIYRQRDGLYMVDVLTAAISHLDFFTWLAERPAMDKETICQGLDLRERPADVMLTLFTAMELLESKDGIFQLTEMSREHLVKHSPWFIGPYYDSMKERPVCRDILTVLRTGQPANWASLKSEKDWARAMEGEAFANQFTAAMDCRGTLLGPAMASRLDCSHHNQLLDIAGGSGIYACAIVAHHPHLRATVLEKPPVDGVTRRSLAARGFADRITVSVGDMFMDPFPGGCDIHLFSNVLHDWDVPRVKQLLAKSCAALPAGGMIVIHDAHLNSTKTGPLPVAAYSALLMTITEGRCYSEKEMADFLEEAGFTGVNYFPTAADRSVITARKG